VYYRSLVTHYHNRTLLEVESDFVPLPALQVRDGDADLTLFFLSTNAIHFATPATDPWYNATTRRGKIYFEREGVLQEIDTYLQNQPASPLACKFQYQWCAPTPAGHRCSSLAAYLDALDEIDLLTRSADMVDNSRIMWWSWAIERGWESFGRVARILNSNSLQCRDGLNNGVQSPIPDNQWILDVQNWYAISMATAQHSVVTFANGVALEDPNMAPFHNVPPKTTEEIKLSRSQVTLFCPIPHFGIADESNEAPYRRSAALNTYLSASSASASSSRSAL
jgi:hypothetical protein